jgi:hypothetical protein
VEEEQGEQRMLSPAGQEQPLTIPEYFKAAEDPELESRRLAHLGIRWPQSEQSLPCPSPAGRYLLSIRFAARSSG